MVMRLTLVLGLLACMSGCESLVESLSPYQGAKPGWSNEPPRGLRSHRTPPAAFDEMPESKPLPTGKPAETKSESGWTFPLAKPSYEE